MSAHLNFAIETARLRLRAWRADDFPAFAQLNADAQVMRYFPSPLTQTESDALAQMFQQFINQNGWGFWAVELKQVRSSLDLQAYMLNLSALIFHPVSKLVGDWTRSFGIRVMRQKLHRLAYNLLFRF